MKFKESLRRFFGIKTEEELREIENKSNKQKVIDFFKSLGIALVAALIIITFIIQNTRIPTGSMEDTILVGDFVLVNKFVYGATSPRYVPFTEIELPYFQLPAFKDPERLDIVVFEYPGDRDVLEPQQKNVNYVKRCVGIPGDTLQIIDKVVFVNGKELWIPSYIKYLRPRTKPRGEIETRIFPKGKNWNEDNYGPLVVPEKGDVINLTLKNVEEWRTLIDREFGEKVVEVKDSTIYIKGQPVNSYVIQKDYYFMMGDNRDDSLDSRFWGFVPRDLVVGQAFILLFSWDRDIPFSKPFKLLGSIRLDRVLRLIN